MSWLTAAVLVVLATVVGTWIAAVTRRRRERRRAAREALRGRVIEVLSGTGGGPEGGPSSDLSLVESDDGSLRVRGAGAEIPLPIAQLRDATSLDGLGESLEFQLSHAVRPHTRALTLNKQARHLAPLMVRRRWLDWFPDGPPPHTDLAATGLSVLYRFLDERQPDSSSPTEAASGTTRYLHRDSLDATGLDVEGLHGAMMALLGQQLDEEPILRLGPADAPHVIEDGRGLSSSFLFLLPELLDGDRELVALVPMAGRLVLAHPSSLADAMEVARGDPSGDPSGGDPAGSDSTEGWLLGVPLTIRRDGIQLAKAFGADC